MSNSFQIGDREFKVSKINAMKQYHIVRRVAPILSELLPIMKDLAKSAGKEMTQDEQLDQAAKFVGPVMNGLSRLSDKDSEFVLYNLLSAVEIKQAEGNWARIVVNDSLMFDNLSLPVMLQAAGRAFMFNMTGFFAEHQRSL